MKPSTGGGEWGTNAELPVIGFHRHLICRTTVWTVPPTVDERAVDERSVLRQAQPMNVVVLVGKVAEKPFNPGGDRVVLKLDITSERRSDVFDRIEVHCFGGIGELVMDKVRPGETVSVRGRLEIRVGRDDEGSYEELRVVAQHVGRYQAPAAGPTPVP